MSGSNHPADAARSRALGKLRRMHPDEFADLLIAERLRIGLPAEARRGRPRISAERKRARVARARAERERARAALDRARAALDRELVERYLAGATLEEVGAEHGWTREAARLRIARAAPWAVGLVRARKQARKRTRRAAAEHRREVERVGELHERGVPCVTCGAPTLPHHAPNTTCSPTCGTLYLALRNHLDRPDRLYIRPGSQADEAAAEAYRRSLPIFDRLSERVQRQIRGDAPRERSYHRLYGVGRDRKAHPCERCGAETRNIRFCSKGCYRSSGIGRTRERRSA